MKEYFAKLSSMERRFVVGVLLIVFAALNAWLVWPRFGDWKKNQARMDKTRRTLKVFEDKIAGATELERKIKQLESEGAAVPQEDQAIDFANTIQRQAAASSVVIQSMNRVPPRTNAFFMEVAQALKIQSNEAQLVDFLYKLGAGNSLVRVRGLSLGPDAPRHNLRVDVTLVGSYQKKVTARPAPAAPAAATATAPAVKPPEPVAGKSQPPGTGVPKLPPPTKK